MLEIDNQQTGFDFGSHPVPCTTNPLGAKGCGEAGTTGLGIRQRLSLAVAIIHAPDILILDEPTSGVDPVARDGFWRILVDLSKKLSRDARKLVEELKKEGG